MLRVQNASCLCEALESRRLLSAVRFAVIGDYGADTPEEADVAQEVARWKPNLILTVGDNNYPSGAQATIDEHLGQYYHRFIYPYQGVYGSGAADATNHFFPTLGNHDWYTAGAKPYLNYFALPGNERYYTFSAGPVQFFALDSDPHEPDLDYVNAKTSTANSKQGQWLQKALAQSTAPWKIVYFHHAPYSSGDVHGPSRWMQWPFKAWGASAVLAGHDHTYERLWVDGLPYFVNGAGGDDLYGFTDPVPGSQVRYSDDHGAMLVDASDTAITFQFITRTGQVIDRYTLAVPGALPSPWVSSDVGHTALPGRASYAAKTFTVQASGQDIWRTRDSFHFVYQPLRGDGQIIARVQGLDSTNPWAKAGIMFRQSLRFDSPYAGVFLSPAGSVLFQQRFTQRSRSFCTITDGIQAPYWLKLVRNGNRLTAYVSRLGKKWNLIGSAKVRMPRSVFVGLALTSRNQQVLNTAMFDKVYVSSISAQTTANLTPTSVTPTPSRAATVPAAPWSQRLINWENPAVYPAYRDPLRSHQHVLE